MPLESAASLKTVVLCGGLGTRIRDVAEDVPKPMIQIGGLPILWHAMKYYGGSEFRRFVLCLGYKGQVIKSFFLNCEAYTADFTIVLGSAAQPFYHNSRPEAGWEITLAETGMKTATGGRVARIRRYVDDSENFLLTYGDCLSDVNLPALLDFHRSHGRVLTVTGVRPPGRFGELEYRRDCVVTGFNEKPRVSGGRISAGFFVCRRELFDYVADDANLVFENEPMQRLVREEQLMVFEHDGFWQSMDTYRDYTYLNELYENGEAPWVE